MRSFIDLEQVISYLKENIDIVEVIGRELTIHDAGSDLKKAVCCFHEEKTPSLAITPSKGLYHCFGCKASGDIISFYKEYHNKDTYEAINELAESYNLDLSVYQRDLTPEEKELHSIREIAGTIRDYMNSILGGSNAQEFLEDRGIGKETADEFGLGYSHNPRDIINNFIDSQDELNRIGISTDKHNRWHNVVVYPLHDPRGRVVGFKNRPLDEGKPKFLGTPDTSPIHDDAHIYGFHIARKHMKDGKIIVVEGQHDVITAHQKGIKNVVGTDSTALNEHKINRMKEFGVKEIIVVYDGDNAGRDASLKLASNPIDGVIMKIATMPDGEDPDTFIGKYGRTPFLEVVYNAVYASQYLVDNLAKKKILNTITAKIDFIKECESIIFNANVIEKTFIVPYIAEKVDINPSVIEDMIRQEQSKKQKSLLYNLKAERVVLGGILREEDFRNEAMEELRKNDFYLYKHGVMFDMVQEMAQQSVPITIDTIKTTMNNREYKQLFDDGRLVDELFSEVGTHHALIEDIRDKSVRRKLIQEARELEQKAHDVKTSVVYTIEDHITKIEDISDGSMGMSTVTTPERGAKEFMDTLHERMNMPDQIVGIDAGPRFKSFTSILNGLQDKSLITIAANQSVGKTTLTTNIIEDVSIRQKIPWAHFTLEMPSEQMVAKFIGIRSGVNSRKIKMGNLTDEEYRQVQQATIDYYSSKLFVIDDCTTLESIVSRTRTLIRKHGIKGVSIDYMQLMTLEKSFGKKKYEEEGDISGALKNDVAKKLGIPVINISQMSRRALDREIQKAEDGQGAYKIAQDSDVYIILQNKSQEDIDANGVQFGNQIINIDKNRDGKDDVLIDLFFDRDTQRMHEVN
ncbi:DNA primase [Bacillus phage vB_BpsS-140]|nr:DNA primase [Bacillus phage vB_BpsS-140]